jgi:hypothetical protein
MADTWDCPICKSQLRCSCQSQECGFDYDIKDHVRNHLTKAIETALMWYDCTAVINISNRAISDNKEPCCDACAKN